MSDNVRSFAEQIHTISEEIMRGSKDVAESIRLSFDAAGDLREAVYRTATSYEGILGASRETVHRAGEMSGAAVPAGCRLLESCDRRKTGL